MPRNYLTHDKLIRLDDWVKSYKALNAFNTFDDVLEKASTALEFKVSTTNLRNAAARHHVIFKPTPRKPRSVMASNKRKDDAVATREDLRVVARELLALCGQLGFSPDAALIKYAAAPQQPPLV